MHCRVYLISPTPFYPDTQIAIDQKNAHMLAIELYEFLFSAFVESPRFQSTLGRL
jgi:hypothetical protein